MAVAVPLLMGAFGAGTTAIAITTIAFSVTGINDKINKAASKVFGADLVGFANLAGMAYGAFNGGFGGADAATGGADAATSAAWSDGAAGLGQDTMSAMGMGEAAFGAPEAVESYNLMSQADAPNLFQAQAGTNQFADKTLPEAPAPVSAGRSLTPSIADKVAADGAPATTQTTAGPALKAAGASESNAAGASATKAGADVAAPKSVMDRIMGMVTDKDGNISKQAMELGGGVLKGAAGAYSASAARRQAQEQFDAEWNRRERNAGAVGWKQPA